MNSLRRLILVCAALTLGACVVYEPVPMSQPSPQQRFDRSWSAAAGALADQGLAVSEDRAAGVVRGQRGGIVVTAALDTLPDGRIQVKFASQGEAVADAALMQRVSDSYDRRMGR